VLRDWDAGGSLSGAKGKGKENWVGWGVRSISVCLPWFGLWKLELTRQNALAFLNASPLNLHHAYLLPSTVFITPAMEWRLGGFELLTGKDDSAGVLWGLGGLAPGDVGERSAPEVRKGGWTVLREYVSCPIPYTRD
jgi:SCY1-like protein 1